MTYNPRIKNRRNNKLQVTGSVLTGTVADFGVVSGSTVTGSTGLFDSITVGTINVTTTIDTTASFATNAGLLDGLDSSAFVQTANLATSAVTSLTAGSGLTSTGTTGSVTLNVGQGTGILVNTDDIAIDTGVVVTLADSQTISGVKTFSNGLTSSGNLSGTTAQFTSITGTLAGSITGNAATVTNGVYTDTIANLAVTVLNAGEGLSGSATNGVVTLDVKTGDGLQIVSDQVVVDTSVVRTSGGQSIAGNTTFTNITVNGTASIAQLNTVNQSSLVVGDKYITILSGGVDHPILDGSGFLWGSGSTNNAESTGALGEHAHVLYDATLDALKVFPGLYVDGATTLDTVSGTTAEFTSLTGTLAGSITGNAATVTNGVYTNTIANLAVTALSAGNGLTGTDTTGSVTLNVGQGTGIIVNSNDISIDTTAVVTITGTQTVTGVKTFNEATVSALSTNVTGVTANFDVGTLGNRHIILVSCSADITGTLPLAANAPFRQVVFKKTDATDFVIAISASGGETIDGDAKAEIFTQYETLTIVSDGVNKWLII